MMIAAMRLTHDTESHRKVVAAAMRGMALVLLASGVVVTAAGGGETARQYQGPCALVASPDGRTLFIACADSLEIARIDLSSGKITQRTTMPASPIGLAMTPDGTKLIVACAAPRSTIVVLDAASGRRTAAIPAGHTSMGPAISPDGNRLYVCNRFSNDVSVIDLGASRELARIPAVREPIAAAITPDGQTVLVANHLPKTRNDSGFHGAVSPLVTVIDARTHTTSAIALPDSATGVRGLCLSLDGRYAFVTHLVSNFQWGPFIADGGWINVNVVSIIDVRKRKLVRTIGMDENALGAANPWDVVCTADGQSVCVSLSGTHELCVIGASELLSQPARVMSPVMGMWPVYPNLDRSAWRRIKLPGKGPRGLAVAGAKVFVAEYFSDEVAAIDLSVGEQPLTAFAVGPTPRLTDERRGELLFHDATLCFQQWQSCASCHPDGRTDAVNWDLANDGHGNPKNTKSMLWAHRTAPAMWEGVRMSAEVAVRSGLVHILLAEPLEDEASAIDAYLKSLRPAPSPHLVDSRLSPSAVRGQKLFFDERVGCSRCHPAPLYTDLRSYDGDLRGPVPRTKGFDTPTLVEVWRTAPYLHDGRYTTVKELLVEGGHGLPRGGAELDEQAIEDLVEFVLSL